MIVCPNCNHQNPDGATQCEACYTPLPATTTCPNCGATVQEDASFCGQCGSNLNLNSSATVGSGMTSAPNSLPDVPDLVPPDPLIAPEPIMSSPPSNPEPDYTSSPSPSPSPLPATVVSQPIGSEAQQASTPDAETQPPYPSTAGRSSTSQTILQLQSAYLLHVQTNTRFDLPALSVIHMGKPNDQIPPDIDVSGLPNSEIVSRVHADIRVEGDAYFIEDVGSSNGTYINHSPLPKGNRHRLRTGDRISLGKGDQVTFLFHTA